MIDRDTILRRLLRRIQQHGYYHHTDVAMVELLTDGGRTREVAEKHLLKPDTLYKQMERLRKQEDAS